MPCISDFPEPTTRQVHLQETAQLLVWVLPLLAKNIPANVAAQARNEYANDDTLVPMLCEIVRNLSPTGKRDLVYDAHNKMSRRLATWWENHEEADRKRTASEKKDAKTKALRESALSKLSAAERDALGL